MSISQNKTTKAGDINAKYVGLEMPFASIVARLERFNVDAGIGFRCGCEAFEVCLK
jgi:hypothetical protein